jgi:radical SAM protein with 4Fe4S-binding SPASM domain
MGVIDEELFHNELFVGCSAGIYYMGLRPNGDIVPCQLNTYVLDNICNNSLKEVWQNNPLLEQWRKREVKNTCGTCQFLYKCGGCRCNAVAYTGDFLGEDPLCPFTQSERYEQYAVMDKKPSLQPLSELYEVPDDCTVLKSSTLSTLQGDSLIIHHEKIDAYVELTGDARIIYELLSDDKPLLFGELKKQFKEKTGMEMPLDEFSDLVQYKLIEVHHK